MWCWSPLAEGVWGHQLHSQKEKIRGVFSWQPHHAKSLQHFSHPRLAFDLLQQATERLPGPPGHTPCFRWLSLGRCEAGSPAGMLTLREGPLQRGEGDGSPGLSDEWTGQVEKWKAWRQAWGPGEVAACSLKQNVRQGLIWWMIKLINYPNSALLVHTICFNKWTQNWISTQHNKSLLLYHEMISVPDGRGTLHVAIQGSRILTFSSGLATPGWQCR